MRLLIALLLLTGCSKQIVEQPETNTTTNTTTITYTCVDSQPYPLGVVKTKCHSKHECVRICK